MVSACRNRHVDWKSNARSSQRDVLQVANNTLVPSRILLARLSSLKCHSLRIQARSDAAREVFPTKVTQSLYRTLRDTEVVPFLHSSSNLQHQTNNFVSPTNCGGCQAQTAHKCTKPKQSKVSAIVFVFFRFNSSKQNNIKVTRELSYD
jgi:hypothetical protein